jgi:hypothetical protein
MVNCFSNFIFEKQINQLCPPTFPQREIKSRMKIKIRKKIRSTIQSKRMTKRNSTRDYDKNEPAE